MPDVNTEELQRISQRNYGLDLNGGLRIATGINKDVNGITQQLYGKDLNGAFDQVKTVLGGRAVRLNGTTAYVDTPDVAALDILGDIDLRFEWIENRNPAVSNATLISKWGAAGQRSFKWWDINIFSIDEFVWSADGTASVAPADFAPANTRSGRGARRVTLDVVNGANRVITWYEAPSLGGTFIQRNQSTVAGNTSIFNSTALPTIGAQSGGAADFFNGDITRVEIRNSIGGTIVANPDFRFMAPGATTVVDSTGKTWTLRGGATVV